MKRVYRCLVSLALIGPFFIQGKPCFSQQVTVTNVSFALRGNKVIVYYNLNGPPGKTYNVALALRREGDSGFRFIPIAVSGDVGRGKFEGAGRKIIWSIYSDLPDGLEGNDYYFQVTASLLKQGGLSWLYYVGGAVLLGSTAAAVLYKTGLSGKGGTSYFPTPPIRP
jgi:hypothetical protein